MALVFQAASDESESPDGKGDMYYGGYLAAVDAWIKTITPAWEDRILNKEPTIPFLHMTDIRSRAWREKYGLTKDEADDKVEEAVKLINENLGTIVPAMARLDAGYFRHRFPSTRMVRQNTKQPALAKLEPDVAGFYVFCDRVLQYVHEEYPEVQRVDFVVERSEKTIHLLSEFHGNLAANLRDKGLGHLADLMGEFLPVGKENVLVQAADVVCWHTQRVQSGVFDPKDEERFLRIADGMIMADLLNDGIDGVAANSHKHAAPNPFKPKRKPTDV